MNDQIVCPVDRVYVNENKVRTTALFVLLISIAFVLTGSWLLVVFLLADFLLRAFNMNNYSPLAILSGVVVKRIRLKNIPIDRAPKRFAAFVGIVFLTAILIAILSGEILAAKILSAVLIIFAALESLAGICAGCYVYSALIRLPILKNRLS